jgi:hypothetical protein
LRRLNPAAIPHQCLGFTSTRGHTDAIGGLSGSITRISDFPRKQGPRIIEPDGI